TSEPLFFRVAAHKFPQLTCSSAVSHSPIFVRATYLSYGKRQPPRLRGIRKSYLIESRHRQIIDGEAIGHERTGSLLTAIAIKGKREEKSFPARVISRTPAESRRARIR